MRNAVAYLTQEARWGLQGPLRPARRREQTGGQQILLDDDIAAEDERLPSAGLQFRNDGSGNPIELFQLATL